MLDHKKQRDLMQSQWRDFIHNRLGTEPWVYVYSNDEVNSLDFALFYCALIPNREVERVLQTINWDLHLGDGGPGCSVTYKNGKKIVKYHRYGNRDGIEPLVLYRTFQGIENEHLEISEEFRLFHNLYYDKATNRYIKIDEAGDEEDVIIFEQDPTRIRVKLKPLKQFLAIKEMHLAIFFSIDVYSDKSLKELGLEKIQKSVREPNLTYDFFIDTPYDALSKYGQSFSRLFGKKLIPGMPKETCGYWPYERERKYENFIIGTDVNGDPVMYTCNPKVLNNYFGSNPDAPHYLTQVFFKREVLAKYYSNPAKYTVGDSTIYCHGSWTLRVDNNHDKYIVVYLGDLGRNLPHKEQVYWKSYNVEPDGTISETHFRRGFLAQWTDPEKVDLIFKSKYEQFKDMWQKSFGWPFFKPLSKDDEHNFKTLRVPLTDDQHEFDQQVLALAKIFIDSLNEKEIAAQLPDNVKGSISKLEKFLETKGVTDFDPYIKFLRSLWDLRIGVGHRKGDVYKRGAAYFRLDERPLSQVFEDILQQATDLLKYLEERLITESTSEE